MKPHKCQKASYFTKAVLKRRIDLALREHLLLLLEENGLWLDARSASLKI